MCIPLTAPDSFIVSLATIYHMLPEILGLISSPSLRFFFCNISDISPSSLVLCYHRFHARTCVHFQYALRPSVILFHDFGQCPLPFSFLFFLPVSILSLIHSISTVSIFLLLLPPFSAPQLILSRLHCFFPART